MKKLLIVFSILVIAACSELEMLLEDSETISTVENEPTDLIEGLVTYVVDGDTFDVELDNGEIERVRPILVDAPEICHASSPSHCEPDPYGDEATEFTRDLLDGEVVYLEKDVSERDKYDRMLFYVYLEDGRMYQELILAEGLATLAIYEPDVKYKNELLLIEEKAKQESLNIWSN